METICALVLLAMLAALLPYSVLFILSVYRTWQYKRRIRRSRPLFLIENPRR